MFEKGVGVVTNKNTEIQGMNGTVVGVNSNGVNITFDAFGGETTVSWESSLRDLVIYVD